MQNLIFPQVISLEAESLKNKQTKTPGSVVVVGSELARPQ